MPSTTPDLFDSSPLPVRALPGLSLAPAVPQGTPRRAARELWLCLLLPGLPLEALVGDGVGGGRPACVVDGEGTRQVVVAVNDAAARHGVRPGLGLNAALALCAGLDLLKRRPDAEAALLERLARWGTQFTPWVSLEPPQALLAEVRGSLGLFGGAANLRRRAVQELFGRGLRAVAALAPTPRSALWLARAGLEVTVESGDELPSFAARLPLACLGWPQAAMQTLATLGTRSVADLARLPRDGLARRLGPALLDELDEGFGRRAQPRRRAVLPERFDDALELPAESASGGLIELALDRLLGRLQDFLRDRSGGVRGLLVEFRHRGLPPTRLRLGLARPGDDARHLATLLRERLAHTPLPAPVVSLRVRSTAVVPLELRAGSLPGETRRDADPEAAARLLERLRARLGAERVFSVCLVPEHRPELAWRVAEPLLPGTGNAPGKGESADGARGRKRAATGVCGEEGQGRAPPERATSTGASGVAGPAAASSSPQTPATSPSLPRAPNAMRRLPRESRLACAPVALRPLWILAEPQRLQERDGSPWHEGGPLELVSGPERIESGWWDGGDVRRDYYVATERGGVRLWVYGERDPGGGWWLHGVFG